MFRPRVLTARPSIFSWSTRAFSSADWRDLLFFAISVSDSGFYPARARAAYIHLPRGYRVGLPDSATPQKNISYSSILSFIPCWQLVPGNVDIDPYRRF